jgi:hypothetical protein
MSPSELLEISKNTFTVAFHKFVLLSRGRENDLFCFLEGMDSQYYSSRVRQFVRKNYHPISCGNKSSVLRTYALFRNASIYSDISKAFFVDRDFDECINNPDIYETPCYSVENLYVNEETLKEILKNEFGLLESDIEYTQIVDLFNVEIDQFSKESLLFNAWYATLKREKVKKMFKTTGVNLDEKIPKEFLFLKIGAIKSDYDLKKIKEYFPEAIEVNQADLELTIQVLLKNDLSKCLRGKFQMWFFYTFLQFIINDANNIKSIIKKKTKFKIEKALIHSQLSQYAQTPDCLVNYLQQFN